MDIRTLAENPYVLQISSITDAAAAVVASALEGDLSAIDLRLVFIAVGEKVTVEGVVRLDAVTACARCGEDAPLHIDAPVRLVYVPETESDADSRELSAEELELGWYRGGVIEPLDVLSEAVALVNPDRVECADAIACDARATALLASQEMPPEEEIGLKALGSLRFPG